MIYKVMPYFIFKRLWGDRKQFGIVADFNDPDYKNWQNSIMTFYKSTQKGQIGSVVNHYGFRILKTVSLEGKKILEIGPGIVEHLKYHNGVPREYHLVDVNPEFLDLSKGILQSRYNSIYCHQNKGSELPFEDNQFDLVISFHQLEHCVELEKFLKEIFRVLKPGGQLVGAVPTEGSFAWGLGRFFTSRRYVHKNFTFSLDKIICWEHPNFVDKIVRSMKQKFHLQTLRKRPFRLLPMDMNLSLSFIALKEGPDGRQS